MDWLVIGVVFFIVGSGCLLLWFQLKGRVTDEQIREFLSGGALVVDVRTVAEYDERSVTGTINIPLDKVVELICETATDTSQVILCHCESGGRSAIAVARLRRAGYTNAFNLGSYKRAAALLESSA